MSAREVSAYFPAQPSASSPESLSGSLRLSSESPPRSQSLRSSFTSSPLSTGVGVNNVGGAKTSTADVGTAEILKSRLRRGAILRATVLAYCVFYFLIRCQWIGGGGLSYLRVAN